MQKTNVKYKDGYFEFEISENNWLRSDEVPMNLFSAFYVISKGGEQIPLDELIYWNVGKQIPYKNIQEVKEDFKVNVMETYK